jgi:hypothetical protein
LAEIELLRSAPSEALALALAGLELSTRYGYLYDAALCERAVGQALLALGDADGRGHLESAVRHFAAIKAAPEVARTEQAIAALGASR